MVEHVRLSAKFLPAVLPVLTSLGTTVPPVLGHQIAHGLHVGLGSATTVTTVYVVGLAVATPVAGLLVDAIGTAAVLLIGGAGLVVGSLLLLAAPSLASVLAVRVAQGAATALVGTAAFTRVSAGSTEQERVRRLGMLTAGTSAMYGLGPLLGASLGAAFGWRLAMTAPVIAGALALVEAAVGSADHAPTRPRLRVDGIVQLLRTPAVPRLLVAGAALNGTSLAVAVIAPLRLVGTHALSAGDGARLVPTAVIAASVALLIGHAQVPIRRCFPLAACVVSSVVLVAGLTDTQVGVVAAAGVATGGFAVAQILLLGHLPESVRPEALGTALSIGTLSILCGGFLGSLIAGLLVGATSPAAALPLVALLPLPALAALGGRANVIKATVTFR